MKSPMPKTKTKSETANIYAVVGSDESEVKRTGRRAGAETGARRTRAILAWKHRWLRGQRRAGGLADSIRDRGAADASFFWRRETRLAKKCKFPRRSSQARPAAVQTALEELTARLEAVIGTGVTFLISATEIDKRRSFYKSLGKRAEVQVFDKLDSVAGRLGGRGDGDGSGSREEEKTAIR